MRRYHREDARNLNDGERYRDYDYLADDEWIGANERVPHGATDERQPAWSTLGPWETAPFSVRRELDEERGQGREYGRDLGLGYGRPADPGRDFERTREDDYDRGYARPQHAGEHQEYGAAAPGAEDGGARPRAAEEPAEPARVERGPRRRRRMVHQELRPIGLRTLIAAMLGVARALGRTFSRQKSARASARSDARIAEEVYRCLSERGDIDASEIVVEVREGKVTLTGVVGDRATRYLAGDLVADVLGVEEVEDQLRVGKSAERGAEDRRRST